jgi:hypothetical protein
MQKIILASAATALLFIGSNSFAATPTSAEMEVRVDIERAADLSVTPIDFGTILINGDAGAVDMDVNGGITPSGGVLQTYGVPTAGSLTIDANNGSVATITMDTTVNLGTAGVVFTPTASATSVNLTGTPSTVTVHGKVEFPAGTETQSLAGLLNINVSYN